MDIRHVLSIIDGTLDEERPEPGTHVLMITGKLARRGLERVMQTINPQDFTYEIRVLDVEVAAWLDAEIIEKDLGTIEADMILVPGKTTGDLQKLSERLNKPVIRGPGCYSELPVFFEENGLERMDDDDVLRPRIAIIGSDIMRSQIAKFLAETYQIPMVSRAKLISDARNANDERSTILRGYNDPPHNVVAELIRERFLEQDVQQGFVLDGYPTSERDFKWLQDMKIGIDAMLIMASDTPELLEAFKDNQRLIVLSPGSEKSVLGEALSRVEELIQTCVFSTDR